MNWKECIIKLLMRNPYPANVENNVSS